MGTDHDADKSKHTVIEQPFLMKKLQECRNQHQNIAWVK